MSVVVPAGAVVLGASEALLVPGVDRSDSRHGEQQDGRQLVPESWIDAVLQVREHPGETADARRNIESPDQPDAAFYTWQWRRMPQGPLLATPPADAAQPAERLVPGTDFYAQGQHGQYIYVAPQQRTVVVTWGV